MTALALSRRLRRTPYSDRVDAAGASAMTVYGHVRLAASFRGIAEDCAHLKRAVQVWDVACERQIRIAGPDADALVALLTPRDLSAAAAGRCYYAPMVGTDGGLIGDPMIRRTADAWYLSLADGDLDLWAEGVAAGRGMDVGVAEADRHTLAVQGPRADALAARVVGDLSDLRPFAARRVAFGGASFWVSRSGFSRQGGFEFYPPARVATALWDDLLAAGTDLDVRVGCPNLIERIEGGLLSYGNDIDRGDTPWEAGLARFCDGRHDCIGRTALDRCRQAGRQIRPLEIEGEVPGCDRAWPVFRDGREVGRVTSAAWAPARGTSVAVGMVARDAWDPRVILSVETQDGRRSARVRDAFWYRETP